jgi:hypothetical protein
MCGMLCFAHPLTKRDGAGDIWLTVAFPRLDRISTASCLRRHSARSGFDERLTL